MSNKKPLRIDMIAGSQLRDTQGEMLSIEGADISEMEAGKGRICDNHGKGFFNSIGRVITAKKIFKEEDCTDGRHKYYWDQIKAPYIYVMADLYDNEDHPNARAAAAILRNIHKSDIPLKLKASVEGGVLLRGLKDPSLLARTKIHSVALTFTPANNATLVEPLNLDKTSFDEAADMALIKSVEHLAQTNVPSFRHIVRDASASKVHDNLQKIADMLQDMGVSTHSVYLPSKEKILEKALEAKVKTNIKNIQHILRTMKNDDFEKAWKDKAMGAAMMGAAALSPAPTAPLQVDNAPVMAQTPKLTHEQVYQDLSKKYPLLGAIGSVESNGGKNLNHPVINSDVLKNFYGIDGKSMNEGMSAGGAYGMMPLSAAFILNKDPKLAKKYPKLAEAAKDVHKNHKLFTDTFNSDPQADADFAVSLYKRNKDKTRSDAQLAYSWLHGLKGSWERYKSNGKKSFDDNKYVKDVMSKLPKKGNLNKALTAGYGGAGAPTNMTQGSVIQSESLQPSLKFITCNNCGKEQVHGKHQIKCRDCGANFSLEKLYSVLKGT